MSGTGAGAHGKSGDGSFPSGDDVGAFVVDVGSLWIRAGNAGDDCPKQFCYSLAGKDCRPLSEPSAVTKAATTLTINNDTNTGKRSESYSGLPCKRAKKTNLHFPMSFSSITTNMEVLPCLYYPSRRKLTSGIPSLESILAPVDTPEIDLEVFETAIEGVFKTGLRVDLNGRPVLLSEPNRHNRKIRVVGRSGGLVIDIGTVSTSITPVQDGYTLQRSIVELPIGGDLLDHQTAYLLQCAGVQDKIVPAYAYKRNYRCAPNVPPSLESILPVDITLCRPSFNVQSQRETLRSMKEVVARVSDDPLAVTSADLESLDLKSVSINIRHAGVTPYELPDGTMINTEDISKRIPECLFNFKLILGLSECPEVGDDLIKRSLSLAHSIVSCVHSCDVDSRRDLLGGLILTGGTTLMGGLAERLTRQFQDDDMLFGTGLKYKVVSPSSTIERRFSAWIGGSIMASLGSFQQMWMSKAEYDEHGAHLLERRCIQ